MQVHQKTPSTLPVSDTVLLFGRVVSSCLRRDCQLHDVATRAHAAAFADPRFPRVRPEEVDDLDYHIAVLGEPVQLRFSDESELLSKLEPGTDGLIVRRGEARATFLPAVWSSIPAPESFLRELKRKAGIGEEAVDFDAYTYRTESFPEG